MSHIDHSIDIMRNEENPKPDFLLIVYPFPVNKLSSPHPTADW